MSFALAFAVAASWLPPTAGLGAARIVSVDLGHTSVTVSWDVAAVERPILVPVRMQARGSDPVTVAMCVDWRCSVRREVSLPRDAELVVEMPLFPSGLQLRLTSEDPARDRYESSCCGAVGSGRPMHVIAFTSAIAAPDELTQASSNGSVDGGALLVTIGDMLRERPAVIDGFGAVVINDETAIDDALAILLREYVSRGGVVSVASGAHASLAGSTEPVGPTPAPSFSIAGQSARLTIPDGTGVVRIGAGSLVVRPRGATRDDSLAGLLAVRPALLSWLMHASPADHAAARVAAAGLAVRPHRGIAFGLAFGAIVGIALAVRSSRRRGWPFAVTASFVAGVAGLASLWMLERVSVPDEARIRVVTWIGPNAAWEVGVDAARPRSARDVSVEVPTPVSAIVVLGEDALPSRPAAWAEGRASARVDSGTALASVWERSAPQQRAVEIVNGVVVNHLAVPVRAVLVVRGARFAMTVDANGARSVADLGYEDRWDALGTTASLGSLTTSERRLLHELAERCSRRISTMPSDRAEVCGGAVAFLADGTLLGVEVSQ